MSALQPEEKDSFARHLRLLASKNTSNPSNLANSSKPLHFITQDQLTELWQAPEILSVLRQYSQCQYITAETIQDGYLRVFSMLVWCDRVEDLGAFTSHGLNDLQFPLRQIPEAFSAEEGLVALFQTIQSLQWTFFPLFIHPDRLGLGVEPPERILPILGEEQIAEGEEAIVFKSFLHPECCDAKVAKSGRCGGKVVAVRKVYGPDFADKPMYDREKSAYQALRNRHCDHIVQYYGAFTHHQVDGTDLRSLLLEFVDGVNLSQFFSRARPPSNKEELLNLWGGFVGLFKALHHIYNHKVQIAHQDISPINLMVCGEPNLRKKLHFKVTDFGYSYTAAQGVSGERLLDMMGGRMYGAPQSCHDDTDLNQGPNTISPAVDVWSAGAIMSDTAAWAYGGQQARKEYNELRLEEVKQRDYFEEIPYFHNGVVRLGVVDTYHRIITDTLPDYDQEITLPILKLIERAMIPAVGGTIAIEQPHSIKAALRKLLESVTESVREPEREPSLELTAEEIETFRSPSLPINNTDEPVQTWDETGTPQTDEPSPTRPRRPLNKSIYYNGLLDQSRPQLSWLDACEYYHRKKKNLPIDKETTAVVETLVSKLRGRDFIFLVDTSISMKPHQESMEGFLLVYSYLVKGMDADGVIDVCYTASGESMSSKKSSVILSDFKKQKWTGLGFEDKLSDLISQMSIRIRDRKGDDRSIMSFRSHQKLTKQSIFVLTDGSWRGLDGIKDHIRRIIQTIKDAGLGRTQFTIQFISFGPDLAGLQRLKELDNFVRDERLGMDIVDTKPFDYDVCAVLFGAIDEAADDEDEIPGSSGMTSPS